MPITAAEPPVSDGNYSDPAGTTPARTDSGGAEAGPNRGLTRCVGCPDGLGADNIGEVGGFVITAIGGTRVIANLVYDLSLAARAASALAATGTTAAAAGPAAVGAVQSKGDALTRAWEAAKGGAVPSTTRLWRAVEAEELADIRRFGDYNIHPNSTFKRFAFSEADLDAFIKANPGRAFTKTFVDLPTNVLRFMTEHPDPGGVGRAIGIDVYERPEFYNWFLGSVKVVQ